jgi:hypothetical protein
MGTFSLRPNVSLNLYMSKSDDPGNNRSLISWDLQLNETAEQPTWNLNLASSGTVSFSWWNGSTSPAIANFAFDFRPTGLQNLSIGSGSFYVTHQTNGVGGTVSGSATAAATSASNGLGTATASNAIGLTDYNRSPVWTTTSSPSPAIRGVSYTGQFTATNTSSYSRTSGTLPPGLSLNSSTGALTGTPTTLGTYNFTITANGAFEGSVSSARTVVVNPPKPVFSDSTIAGIAIRGVAYSDGVAASDTTSYSLASGTLPTGLSFNTSTGAITGTPTTLQSRSIVFRATNVTGSTDTPARSLVVNPPAPVFSDSTLIAQASIGSSYSDAVVASDVTTYSVRNPSNPSLSGTLPAGLTLNSTTGTITGTPTTAGETSFRIRAENVTGSTDTAILTITIISPVRIWVGPEDDDFVIGSLDVWVGPEDDDFVNGVVRVWNGEQFVSAK